METCFKMEKRNITWLHTAPLVWCKSLIWKDAKIFTVPANTSATPSEVGGRACLRSRVRWTSILKLDHSKTNPHLLQCVGESCNTGWRWSSWHVFVDYETSPDSTLTAFKHAISLLTVTSTVFVLCKVLSVSVLWVMMQSDCCCKRFMSNKWGAFTN